MKRMGISLLLGVLLLFSVWVGARTAESSSIGQTELLPGSVSDEGPSDPVTDTYTHFVYFPVVFQQYAVPTWQQLGLQGVQVVSIAVAPNGTLYAGTSDQGLYRSLDSGVTWLPANEGHSDQAGVGEIEIAPHDTQSMYITSNQALSHFFISHDAGQSWTPGGAIAFVPKVLESVTTMPGRLFVADCPLDSGGGRVYRSEDSGLSWTMVITEQVLPTEIAPSPVNSNTVYVSAARGLYRSTDGGSNWEQLTNGLPTNAFSDIVLHPTTPLTAYVGVDAGIYKTTDGGITWKEINNGLNSSIINSLILNKRNPQHLFIGTEDNGVFVSINSGEEWTPLKDSQADEWVYGLSLDDRTEKLYFSTQQGTFVAENIFTSINEVDNKPLAEFKLYQNYPNPFNPSTTIRYSVPYSGNVKIVVFDIQGKEIATLHNKYQKNGNYKIVFNPITKGINLVSGIYFYKLISDNFIQTKKMVYLK